MLVEILCEGEVVYDFPGIDEMRAARDADLERLDDGVRRIINPHVYHVSLSRRLWELKLQLIARFGAGD